MPEANGLPLGARWKTTGAARIKPGSTKTEFRELDVYVCPPCRRHLRGTVCEEFEFTDRQGGVSAGAGRPCSCFQCSQRRYWAEVDRILDREPPVRPGEAQRLRNLLRRARHYHNGAAHHRAVRAARADLPMGPCHCFRPLPGDPSRHCMIAGEGFGVALPRRRTSRKYRSKACQAFCYRARKKAQLFETNEAPLSARAAARPSLHDERVPLWRQERFG